MEKYNNGNPRSKYNKDTKLLAFINSIKFVKASEIIIPYEYTE